MNSNELTIEKLFLILRARIRLISGIFLSMVLIAAIITYQTPKMYAASASLHFEFSAMNPLDERGGSVLAQGSYINTQISILESLHVAQAVVDSLSDYERERVIAALNARSSTLQKLFRSIKKSMASLFQNTKKYDGSAKVKNSRSGETLQVQSRYDWLARSIGSDLSVGQVFNSRLVEVTYFSTQPSISALIANRFAKAYIDTNLKMVIDPVHRSKVWFDEQLKSLRVRLEEAQDKLTVYQQKEGIVSSDERIDLETSHLRNLTDELVAAQAATRNAETEKRKLEEVLESGASLMTFEPVFNKQVVQRIRAEIREFEGQLVESSNTLGANHPKIKKLKSELYAARSRLRAETETITNGINNAADLAKQRERTLEQAMEKQKELVLNLKKQHDRISVFEREVESAQTTYNAALEQLNTTSMQSMVDQANVSIVDYANVPTIHAKPNMMKNLAIGAFGGLLLGIGLAIFLGVSIRKVDSEEDLIKELAIPLLGHLKKA